MPITCTKFWRYAIQTGLLFLCLFCLPSSANLNSSNIYSNVPTTPITLHGLPTTVTSHMAIGATHEHSDADSWNNSKAVASAKQLMQTSLTYQNQQIMGWGVDDPEPSPGVYHWDSLDERVQLMRDTKAKMVLTLCCAPSWMRPQGYQNDWQDLETAPAPSHVQDFANLAVQVALRYPDVKYFQVWNELKGMWSNSPGATPGIKSFNRWDYKRYTTLYNAVYDAIKAVRPDAQIGGPYVVMNSDGSTSTMSNPGPSYSWGTLDQRSLDVLTYWLAYKHGADFITIDGGSSNQDGVWLTNEFAAAQKFIDVYHWIRSQPHGGATLPIWWAEWYAEYPSSAPQNLNYYNAVMASDAIYTIMSGASVTLIWQPQGNTHGLSYPEGIWTDTSKSKGGKPTPYYYTSTALKRYFGPGTQLYKPSVSNSTVTVIASAHKMMLVNHLSTQQNVVVDNTTIKLDPYQVLVTATV
jgi:hypothetical protein